ncbi:SCO family protein [Pseudoalteromonas byunsanensis]|uniref:SCO family protein n=1 Tax=Pseudoalteromonas byunsanensis TaxID=327939 RepID=A0A1S1N1B2_9GAMM|nr:SCO family protein [Pseudoalteromonas byunsanensis]OHU94979.1 hypothetical protein BIW53_13260 [Pseudoalteromonas byunsanensis]
MAMAVISMAIMLGVMLSLFAPKVSSSNGIEWLAKPKDIVNFTLRTQTGKYNRQSLLGRFSIVWFGFLKCVDVCPLSLMQASELAKQLHKLGTEPVPVSFVFVSVDPERDSTEHIAQFVEYFDGSFLGATADKLALERLTSSLGVRFRISSTGKNYNVSHSVMFSVIAPDGSLVGRFAPGFDAKALAQELRVYMRAYKRRQ